MSSVNNSAVSIYFWLGVIIVILLFPGVTLLSPNLRPDHEITASSDSNLTYSTETTEIESELDKSDKENFDTDDSAALSSHVSQPELEQEELLRSPTVTPLGSRGIRKGEQGYNDHPANATRLISNPTAANGTINPITDVDWFKIKLKTYEHENNLYVQNLTVRLNSMVSNPLIGDTEYNLGVSIYGVQDINQDEDIDLDTEIFLIRMEIYRIGIATGPTLFIQSFNSEFYYIKFETDGGQATYNFRVEKTDFLSPETNPDIYHTNDLNPNVIYRVDVGNDTFDWLKEDSPKINEDTLGFNFSFTAKIKNYKSTSAVTLPNGTTIYWVTVLHILVYHEDKIIGGVPTFQYRDHLMLSRQPQTKLSSKVTYTDIITKPTSLFKYTYLGFYIEVYGIDTKTQGVKFYPVVDELVEHSSEGYCSFEIEEAGVEEIVRPELVRASVISETTGNIFGRTYDDYNYSVIYKHPDNNPPIIAHVSIFGTGGERRENMIKIEPEYVEPEEQYIVGVEYYYIFSGLLLGEGDHHIYQYHFKDKDSYAIGSIELGKSWHGPYISNNIRPYVRPSAPTSLTISEDDNTTFFDLDTIFEDTDIKEELNFTIAEPDTMPEDRVWSKTFDNSILNITIEEQTQMKIELKPNQNGEVKILINVTDKHHFYLDPPFDFTINVLPVNDPPQIIQYFDKLELDEDEINMDIYLKEHFVDTIDNEELTFRYGNNRNINIKIASNGDVILSPMPNWHGSEYVEFYASDGLAEVMDFLKVIVRPINDVPTLEVNQTIEIWEDTWGNITINASDSADNETILIMHNLTDIFPVLAQKPSRYGYTFDNSTGYLTFIPSNNMVGEYSLNISAVDVHNMLNFTHVTLIIHNVNDPPVPRILYPGPDARYLTIDKISFRGEAYDPDSILAESDFLWYSSISGTWRKIGSGRTVPQQLYENGTHLIILSVRDDMYIQNITMNIHVFAINQDMDSDEDGIPDYWENLYDLDPTDPHDAEDDPDRDSFTNWEEYKGETDPFNSKSFPDEHITQEKKVEKDDLSLSIGIFSVLIIILILIVFYMVIITRRKRRAEQENKASTKGIIGMDLATRGKKEYGKYKPPKVCCNVCGKTYEVQTLNRPVVVTCSRCGKRGAVYK